MVETILKWLKLSKTEGPKIPIIAALLNIVDFLNCLRVISRHVEHIHLADSLDIDEDGILLGKSVLPLQQFLDIINKKFKNVSIILETWQGYLYEGDDSIKYLAR